MNTYKEMTIRTNINKIIWHKSEGVVLRTHSIQFHAFKRNNIFSPTLSTSISNTIIFAPTPLATKRLSCIQAHLVAFRGWFNSSISWFSTDNEIQYMFCHYCQLHHAQAQQMKPSRGCVNTLISKAPRFRLRRLDDSVRAAAGRRVLRGPAGMRGIQYNSGKSLTFEPLGWPKSPEKSQKFEKSKFNGYILAPKVLWECLNTI